MAFYEEPASKLEKIIGRRFPLAVITLAAIVLLVYLDFDIVASSLGGAYVIILHGYYDDIAQEKQTIKMITDDTPEVFSDGQTTS
jgi:hypothetical protein